MSRQPEELIEGILPSREVHILAGASGSGKSRWWFDNIPKWAKGEDVLGHKSHPVPWVYVSADRSEPSIIRTLRSMNIDPATIPYVAVVDEIVDTPGHYVQIALNRHPEAQLILLEGITSMVPSLNRQDGGYKATSRLLRVLGKLCREYDRTIIGSAHCPKMKPAERYGDPRQRIMGSVAWSGWCETIFLIEDPDPDSKPPTNARTLTVMPRNAAPEVFNYRFDGGHLVPWEDDVDDIFVLEFFRSVGDGQTFTRNVFYQAMRAYMSESTAARRLKDYISSGHLVVADRGTFRVSFPS